MQPLLGVCGEGGIRPPIKINISLETLMEAEEKQTNIADKKMEVHPHVERFRVKPIKKEI